MSDQDTVIPFRPRRQPFGVAQMSLWFQKLGRWLPRVRFQPTGMLVILLNDDDFRIWSAGTRAEVEEAAWMASTYAKHRYHGWQYPDLYPSVTDARPAHHAFRQQQASQEAAYEAAHPWVCEICRRRPRFAREHDYDAHMAVGHCCMTCHVTFDTQEAWDAHPCLTGGTDA